MHRVTQNEDSNQINHENSPRGSPTELGFDSSLGNRAGFDSSMSTFLVLRVEERA